MYQEIHLKLTPLSPITQSVVALNPFLDSDDVPLPSELVDLIQRRLTVTADCNAEMCTQSAGDLAASLRVIEQSISVDSRPAELVSAQQNAERHISAWKDRTQDYLRQKAAEMKDLMMIVARTAEVVAAQDQTHNKDLKGLTERLKSIAELEDITRLRSCLVASVEEMSRTVEQMSRETEKLRRSLETELSTYRSRLEQTEQAALVDPLTGLANRRRIETELNARIRRGQPMVMMLVDLNRFKAINDTHGHLAGDQILRQFAAELKQVANQSDLVGRWGGDEFVVLFNGGRTQAESMRQRIEQWVWGTYPVKVEKGAPSIKLQITAAIGVGIWQQGMNSAELLQMADASMYSDKPRSKSA